MEWLAPLLSAAVALVVGFIVGHWRGSRPAREDARQREIAALLVGEDPNDVRAAAERAVVTDALIETTHRWDQDNNGDS